MAHPLQVRLTAAAGGWMVMTIVATRPSRCILFAQPMAHSFLSAPGLTIATLDANGRIKAEAHGLAHAGTGILMTRQTVGQAASLGKMVAAWLVMRLADQSRLDLDAPVNYEFPLPTPDTSGVTPRRILSHTAGLSVPDYPGFPPDHPLPTLDQSLEGQGGEIAPVVLQYKPGEGFRYSGGGYTLLQYLIEAVTGDDFATHARQVLFEPLGLASCSFADPTGPVADGHDRHNCPLPFYRYRATAAAGLLATAGDLVRFLGACFPGPNGEPPGRGIVSPDSIAVMLTPVADTGRVDGLWASYGLGHELDTLPSGITIGGHHGINRGWRALAALCVERRIAFAAISNGDAGEPDIEAAFASWQRENDL